MRTIFAVSPISSTGNAYNRYNHRFVIAASALQGTASSVRVKFRRTTFDYTLHASIGLQATSGDVYDIDPATLIQFQQIVGTTELHITAGDQYSNTVGLAIDGTRNVVVAIYRDTSGSVGAYFDTGIPKPTGLSIYGRSVTSDESGYANVASYTANISVAYCFEALEGESEPVSVRALLDQPWSAKLSSNVLQSWRSAAPAAVTLSQPYNSAGLLKSVLKEVWKDYGMLRASLQHSWCGLSSTSSMLKNIWSITNTAITNQLNVVYNLKNTDVITKTLQQQYWSTGNTSIETLQSQYVTVNFEIIYPSSIELKTSIDQYAITASIVLASIDDLKKFVPGNTVTVHGALDTIFTFIVDNYDYEISFDTDSFKVDLISPSALLDSPYCALVSGDYVGMASEICETLAAPIAVTWKILDWYVGDGILSASEESPLSVIRKIVNAVGGRVQSNPDGSISVISRYPKSCNTWQAQPTSYSIDYASTVISEQYSFVQAPGYNNFSIKDDSASDTTLRVVTEEIDTNSKQVKVFVYPDVLPSITHSGNATTVTINYSGYVSVTEERQVEFVSGEGSVDGPVFNITSYSWKYRDLGTLTFEPTGTLYSATQGDSLLDVEYSTGYYLYVVSTAVLENVQLIVEVDI